MITACCKRYSLFVFFLLIGSFFTSCRNANETSLVRCNADTARLTNENGLYYQNNKPFSGCLFALYKNGDTAYSKSFYNGQQNGVSKSWYPDKQLDEERYFVKGYKEGIHTGYYPNGTKKFRYCFANDIYEGEQQDWYANGQLYKQTHYANGQESGLQQMWDSTGELLVNYETVNGRHYGYIGTKNCRSIWANDSFVVRH